MSKNFEGAARACGRSTIGLQTLIKLPTTADIDTANVGTVGAARIKISRTARISKGDKRWRSIYAAIARFRAAVSILESEALASELEAMVCKVIDDNKKKKRTREKTPYL